jgi:hypothetical protein
MKKKYIDDLFSHLGIATIRDRGSQSNGFISCSIWFRFSNKTQSKPNISKIEKMPGNVNSLKMVQFHPDPNSSSFVSFPVRVGKNERDQLESRLSQKKRGPLLDTRHVRTHHHSTVTGQECSGVHIGTAFTSVQPESQLAELSGRWFETVGNQSGQFD